MDKAGGGFTVGDIAEDTIAHFIMRIGEGSGSAGTAVTGTAAGTGTTAGAGYCLGNSPGGSAVTGKGAHLTPGYLMAIRAIGGFISLPQGTQPLEVAVAFRTDIFVYRHSISPIYSLACFRLRVKVAFAHRAVRV